jgi:hypothetical protein
LQNIKNKDREVEPKIVAVGDHFINISNLLWARVQPDGRDPRKQVVSLVFSYESGRPTTLNLPSPDAEALINFLRSNSQAL